MTFRLLRLIVVLAAYAFGLTSLTIYYDSQHANLLIFTVLVVMLAHLIVAIGTINTTLYFTSGKRKNSHQNTDNSIKRLWWQATRRSWPWHAALIIPKMGLSLAFVQYFHMSSAYQFYYVPDALPRKIDEAIKSFLRPYIYMSVPTYPDSSEHMPTFLVMPQWETSLLGLIILVIFALAVAGLLVALAILSTRMIANRTGRFIVPLVIRQMIVSVVFIGILIMMPLFYSNRIMPRDTAQNVCINTTSILVPESVPWPSSSNYCLRLAATIQTTGMTLVDQGVLLAANMMRPVGEGTAFTSSNWWEDNEPIAYDNRPFVLRQIVAAALGLSLYGVLTWGALNIAQRRE